MLLSSYDRIRRYIGTAGTAFTDNKGNEQMLTNWIQSVSKQIENYLNRTLLISSYTEYFDIRKARQTEFFVKASPVITLTDVYIDYEGQFDGGESEIEDSIIGINNDSVIIPYPSPLIGKKVMRIRYTGGMAYHGTQSLFTCTITGSPSNNKFYLGGTSGAVGILKANTATTLTIETLYGEFVEDETLTEYDDEDITTPSGVTATLDTITRQSLFEQYPDLVRACEAQIRYNWKHKDDFELSGTNKDGTNLRNTARRSIFMMTAPFTDECISMLQPYKKIVL